MKTKEEILDKKFKEHGIRKGWIDESKQAVLDAMDEYAQQQVKNCTIPDVKEAKRELKTLEDPQERKRIERKLKQRFCEHKRTKYCLRTGGSKCLDCGAL